SQHSKDDFQRHLHDTGIVRTSYVTETTLAGIVDQPIRIGKLRMVKDIECLCPKLQLNVLGNISALQQSHIVIVDARAGEGSPHRVSYCPDWFRDEVVRVEIWQPLSGVPIDVKMTAVVGVAWHIYVCVKGAEQRIIVIFIESDRLSLGECSCAGKLP